MTGAIEIGRFSTLEVVDFVRGGVLLDARPGELFLPTQLAPKDVDIGDSVRVFIYTDHDGQPLPTTRAPAAALGDFACLECVAVTQRGAFLSWGLPKDLYVPPNEQETRMVVGRRYVAVVCLDRKGERLIATTKLAKHFDYDVDDVELDDEVDLLVYEQAEAGIRVVVNQRHRGLIHRSQVHKRLTVGQELCGFVREVREDNRLDIVLERSGVAGIHDAREAILAALRRAGGSLALHDKSSPEEIKRTLGLSKKAFKRGVGGLYKAKRIRLHDASISLVDE